MFSKIILALDVEKDSAEKLVDEMSAHIDIFKVGVHLFTAAGPEVVRMIKDKGGRVFLDLKLHDIPNTVSNAVQEAEKLGVYALTVHTSGGEEMLTKIAGIKPRPLLWGVTVLTSFNDRDLNRLGVQRKVIEQVEHLARLAHQCGLDGVVSSPWEIELMRRVCGEDFTIVTPGIRLKAAIPDDQKRVMTPLEAVKRGADYIVIGRPVLEAENPVETIKQIKQSLGEE